MLWPEAVPTREPADQASLPAEFVGACPLAPSDSKADNTLNIAWEERTIFSPGGLGPPSSQVSSLEASQDLGTGRRFASFSEVPTLCAA